jgi:hypothetical protein
MPMTPELPNGVVFWDIENVHGDFTTHENMMNKIREETTLVRAYAFADWDNRRELAVNLEALGYDLLHIPSDEPNASDYKMGDYIIQHLNRFPDTTQYILITGDGDFHMLVGILKARKRYVWLISNPITTSSELSGLADRYDDIHSFRLRSLENLEQVEEPIHIQKDLTQRRAFAAVQLQEAIKAIQNAGNKPGIGWTKAVMCSLNPDFNEMLLDFETWKEFVYWAESEGYIDTEGEMPATILTIPSEISSESSRISNESKETFELFVKIIEDCLEQGKTPTFTQIGHELKEAGLNYHDIGYKKLTEFVISAEKRDYVRVMSLNTDEQIMLILPVYSVDKLYSWFERNVGSYFGYTANIPKKLFLEKISQLLLNFHCTLKMLESHLQNQSITEEYDAVLEKSEVPFLPPFQKCLFHVLLGTGKNCEETIQAVNVELKPLGISLQCP